MKSIIRWAGSKRQVLAKLRPYWPDASTRYIEPFAGSACSFFALQPKSAILGDLNKELIQTYMALRRDASLVLECFKRFPRSKEEYYKVRALSPSTLSSAEVAARFLYLNRYCFNGLYRTNLEGGFNVPYGPPKKDLLNFEQDVVAAAAILKSATLLTADFEETLRYVRKGDFVYLDPPYMVQRRRVFREYLPRPFCASDLARLSGCLERLDAVGATFLISYADSPEARELLKPWGYRRMCVRRNIAGFVNARRRAVELVGSNKQKAIADAN